MDGGLLSDKSYKQVLEIYQSLIIKSPDTDEGQIRLIILNNAMEALQVIITPQDNTPLSWAIAWFADLGYEEYNAAILTLFLVHWMNSYIGLRKSVDLLIPTG